uniref:Uracil phosphoribosyltransferase n=1 Tax=Paulinella chromatophora TaxID=39717 RepID=B1X453_PAUCH|nr:uracil phosphoribosyltransferase [Paulinella chromatophora]ACB42722.1 uracil phosphoribosyltransferase [Paulinella chromatophora]|eukprot:gb/GEZN01017951.1/.p1 GENE.gb/GEZN01017951.1/~~gb/GEZN01017951.1/.p1  ORF type:complete len:217 (+),score=1.20 gb/GEZN01017951.1/:90-740(+)
MSINLRVVVPPHPLISHWLTVLRDQLTPAPLFATALEQLGHWITYEAVRDWLPHYPVEIETSLGQATGSSIDFEMPLLVIQIVRGGQELWYGAKKVLPNARLAHVTTPKDFLSSQLPLKIGPNEGVLIFLPQITDGQDLGKILCFLTNKGVTGNRRRVITTVVANDGLRFIAENFPDLTIYCACIDPVLNADGHIIPGFGNLEKRLYGFESNISCN